MQPCEKSLSIDRNSKIFSASAGAECIIAIAEFLAALRKNRDAFSSYWSLRANVKPIQFENHNGARRDASIPFFPSFNHCGRS